jgi:serine/threonine protein kinase
MVGSSLGPYQVLAKIGEGGMGEVYRARDTRLKRDVAIKVLPDLLSRRCTASSWVRPTRACPSVRSSWSSSKATRWPSA